MVHVEGELTEDGAPCEAQRGRAVLCIVVRAELVHVVAVEVREDQGVGDPFLLDESCNTGEELSGIPHEGGRIL